MTRCIDTSIAIITSVERITGKRLKLRIEYALCERKSLFSLSCITFDGDNIINNNQNEHDPYVMTDNNNVIDERLMFKNLKKKYSKYIDYNYCSLVSDSDINVERPIVALIDFVSTIKKITTENINSIIVCHNANPFLYTYYYLTQEEFNVSKLLKLYKKLDGAKSLNFVSIFNKYEQLPPQHAPLGFISASNNSPNVWDVVLQPTRII